MVHGALCLAQTEAGATVLVANALPGEVVDATLRYRKGSTWFAEVASVPEPSPHRVAAPCRYVPACGGCQLQHVAYAQQLELKREIVVDALRRQGVAAPDPIRVQGMENPWRYRRRGEFHVVPGAAGARDRGLGFNRARSWRPIAVDDCLIQRSEIASSLGLLRELARQGSDELGTLHVTLGDGCELLLRAKPRRALAQSAVDEASLRCAPPLHLSASATSVSWRGHTYRVTPDAFLQVNEEQMEVLYEQVLAALGGVDGQRVLDAYAGIGVLAVELAERARELVCVESNPAAARLCLLNARLNGAGDVVRVVPRPLEEALPELAGEPIDALVLDPPRAGCDRRVTAWLALAGPARVVYVSCEPATLARDLHLLVASGPYALRSLTIVDMFPQTHHVECVAGLAREPLPGC